MAEQEELQDRDVLARWADTYYNQGWPSVIPVPARTKMIVDSGLTGANGRDLPQDEAVTKLANPRYGNLALRMPDNVIGIDVDAYGEKRGAQTLTELEDGFAGSDGLGPLPPTRLVTSRTDGVSGIRFYRVPEGRVWKGGAGDGIDIISRGYRYAMTAPSLHPEGRPYRWVNESDPDDDRVPHVDSLPLLPEAWVEHCMKGSASQLSGARSSVTHQEAIEKVRGFLPGPPCSCVQAALPGLLAAASRQQGGAHNALLGPVLRMVSLGRNNECRGAGEALEQAMAAYVALDEEPHPTDFMLMLAGTFGRLEASEDVPPPCADQVITYAPEFVDRHRPTTLATASTDPLGDGEEPSTRLKVGAQLFEVKEIPWCVRDWLHRAGVGQIYGPAYSGKSLVAIDLGMSVSNGLADWFGRPIDQSGDVLYIAMEGGPGFASLVQAWIAAHPGTNADRFYVLDEEELNLGNPKSIDRLLRDIDNAGCKPVLVILDTQIEVTPGIPENDNTDLIQVMKGLRRLAVKRGFLGLFVHHTGHKGEHPRGASGQKAAVDVQLHVTEANSGHQFKFTKVKYRGLPKETMAFRIEPVEGTDGAVVVPLTGWEATLAVAGPDSGTEADTAVIAAIMGGATTGRAIADVTGLGPRPTRRTLKGLLDHGSVVNDGTNRQPKYRVPEDPVDTDDDHDQDP